MSDEERVKPRFMAWPAEWEHRIIEAVHEYPDYWSIDFSDHCGLGVLKSEYSYPPPIGAVVSFHWHGLGTPNFGITIGECIVRDFPEDWLGFE